MNQNYLLNTSSYLAFIHGVSTVVNDVIDTQGFFHKGGGRKDYLNIIGGVSPPLGGSGGMPP